MIPMENRFVPVNDRQELEQLITRSHDAPVLLFKHSSTCPISATAYKEMTKLARDIALVVVQSSRDVSRAIEARTGIRHESPQALVLRRGEAVWSASHWNVTADAVERALEENK
jgi:bacillithiol system protein YtxJ